MSRHIVFCLCPGVPLFSIASALEVLRHANRFAEQEYYHWTFLCENNQPVQDSNGLWLHPGKDIVAADAADFAFMVAGFDASQLKQPQLCQWMALQADNGNSIGGISNGAFLLAARGLLDNYSATTHWEDFESFCLLFPQVRARYRRFVIDQNRITCSGGSATLELFIELARLDLGNEISIKISRQLLLQEPTTLAPGNSGKGYLRQQHSAAVYRALSLIEADLDQSRNVTELANRVGVSRRELLRLFRRELNTTPSYILAQRRLHRARSLILNTRLPISTISDSVGFSSQSHLTSHYRSEFGITPAQQRREYKAASLHLPLRSRDFRDW